MNADKIPLEILEKNLEWIYKSCYYFKIRNTKKMSNIIRFGVSIDRHLCTSFDKLIAKKGYKNRSEALRDLIRNSLVEEEWEQKKQETIGTITLVYDHHTREIEKELTRIQHQKFRSIISALHVHLDSSNCIEVLVVRGKSHEIRKIADNLIGTFGVKHGKLTMTSTGKGLV